MMDFNLPDVAAKMLDVTDVKAASAVLLLVLVLIMLPFAG